MEGLELKVEKEPKKEEVENLINDAEKVTDEKIEESLNYNALTDAEKQAIDDFNQKINVEDEVIRNTNFALAKAVRIVLNEGLRLLGIKYLEEM